MASATDSPKGKVRFFDDFFGKALDATNWWNTNSDSGGTAFAINLQQNGVIRGGVDGTDNDLTNLFGEVIWRADAGGPLTLEIRAKTVTSVANGETYIGFSDATTDENPLLVSTTDVLTSAADDAAGFMYTGGGTANWKVAGSKATADTAVYACNVGADNTPVVGTWQTFKIVINEDGDADFYINGIFQRRVDNAVTATTLLNVAVCVQSGGTARSLDIDYIEVTSGRNA